MHALLEAHLIVDSMNSVHVLLCFQVPRDVIFIMDFSSALRGICIVRFVLSIVAGANGALHGHQWTQSECHAMDGRQNG